jgi:hypothetical protein
MPPPSGALEPELTFSNGFSNGRSHLTTLTRGYLKNTHQVREPRLMAGLGVDFFTQTLSQGRHAQRSGQRRCPALERFLR